MSGFSYALELAPGLVSDDTTFAAAGRWADLNNMRFRFGRPEVIGGWKRIWATSTLSGTPSGGWAGYYASGSSAGVVYIGTASKLYRAIPGSGTIADITPAPAPSSAEHWSFGQWGSTLLMTPRNGTLHQHASAGTAAATQVTQAPDNINWMLVGQEERQVIAFGCNEETSGVYNAMCIRWCDLEDYTNWTTLPSNNAGEHVLPGGGKIVHAAHVGTYFGVWTTNTLYRGEFTGNYEQTYRFTPEDEGCGPINERCVGVIDGRAFWVTKDLRFLTWVPAGLVEEVPCPIKKHIEGTFSRDATGNNSCFIYVDQANREVWFHYTNVSAGHYVAFSIADSHWFKGTLTGNSSTRRSLVFDTSGLTGINTNTGTGGASVRFTQTLAVGVNGRVYVHETGTTGEDDALSWHIQSADFHIENGTRRIMVRNCIPDFEDQSGDVSLTLYARSYPVEAAAANGPYTLTTSTRKKDFRASGRLFALRFAGSNVYARLGKPTFDCVRLGDR